MAGFSTTLLCLFPFSFKKHHSSSDCFFLPFVFFCFVYLFFSTHQTVVFYSYDFLLLAGLLVFFLSSYLFVLLFLFCFSFLLPANDNQHTDGKPVPDALSSLPSSTSQFPVISHSVTADHPSRLTLHLMSSP